MSACAPLLVVATPHSSNSDTAKLRERLQKRGLKVQVLRSLQDTAVGDCDVLLVSCDGHPTDRLASELEHLWLQRWNAWYARCGKKRGGNRRARRDAA